MRYLSLFLAIVFIGFALLQINDPDPILWVFIYFTAVYTHFQAYRQRIRLSVTAIFCIAYLLGAIYLFPERFEGFAGKMESRPWVEEARESVGLFICFFTGMYEIGRMWWINRNVEA